MKSKYTSSAIICSTLLALIGCVAPVVGGEGLKDMEVAGTNVPPLGGSPLPDGPGGMTAAGSMSGGTTVSPMGGDIAGMRAGAESAGEVTVAGEIMVAGDEAGEEVQSCIEGETLGLCSVCGVNNTPVVPQDDEGCPEIDCANLVHYSLSDRPNGSPECQRVSFTEGESRCRDVGVCFDDPLDYCVMTEMELVELTGVVGECMMLTGCEGTDEPTLTPLAGQSCDGGSGVCDNSGVCQPTLSCNTLFEWRFNQENQVCADLINEPEGYCDLMIFATGNPFGNNEVTCNQVCGDGMCIASWDEDTNSCTPENGQNCNTRFNSAICRCAP